MNFSKNEFRNRRIALIICLLFLIVVYKCSGQVSSTVPMKFSCGKNDTVYIYIASNSDHSDAKLIVQCSKHQHKNWTGITIGFVDGELLELKSADCYSISNIDKLKSVKFDYLSFDEFLLSTACINIKTKDYFIKFFNDNNLK